MDQPNIIIILADDLGYGDLDCYGSSLNRTPRLDQMAAGGVRFTDFYAPSPVCSPSRAALMTGCYPKRIGLDSGLGFPVLLPADPIGLHPDEVTVADILKSAGYATRIIGKWHLGDQPPFLPTNHGFDSYFGLPYSNDHYVGRKPGERGHLPQPFRDHGFNPLPLMRDDEITEVEPDQSELTARYTEEAIAFMRESKDQPFFLYLAHMYVHTPLFPPEEFLARSNNGPYGAEVECLDWSTGVLLDALRELGIDENTLVIFTSDNGAATHMGSNAPLRGGKGTTWEGGMREPCIARWPGRIPPNTVCREVATTMDLLPTLAKLAGTEPLHDRTIDGHDIGPLLFNPEDAESPYDAFFYYGAGNHTLEAVRSDRWKLHLLRNELYDLRADHKEQHDLFPENPDIVARLTRLAESCRKRLGDAYSGNAGIECRRAGRVEHPVPLSNMDQLSPDIRALYDLDDVRQ